MVKAMPPMAILAWRAWYQRLATLVNHYGHIEQFPAGILNDGNLDHLFL